MPPLKKEDFADWLKVNYENVPLVAWGEHHTIIAVMFANDVIKTLQTLIADICIHEHTKEHNRYASTKDENDMVDQLNDRIMVALGDDQATTIPPSKEDGEK